MSRHHNTILAALVFCWLISSMFTGCRSTTGPQPTLIEEDYVHVRPAWSPDGNTVAFRKALDPTRGIYLVDTSGANMRLVHPGDGVGFTWSPDSRWLAFSLFGTIYKIKTNGDSLTRLTLSSSSIRPAWSADGNSIAYASATIRVLDLPTGVEIDMLHVGDYPSWHPNAYEVVILDALWNPSGFGGTFRFRAIDRNAFSIRTIHSFTNSGDIGFVSISPLGNEILYSVKPDADYTQVWKYVISADLHVKLADGGADFPAWSPDGRSIVYSRTSIGDGGLWLMFSDGTGKRRLTSP